MRSKCEVFGGSKNSDGYGQQRFMGKTHKAHRVAWIKAHGPIPDGMVVMHLCDNPSCIRVSHLKLGTVQDNVSDRDKKERRAAPVGELNGRAILTKEDVLYIRSFRRTPGVQERLSRKFGVSKSTINEVRTKNRNWSHV